VEGQDNDTAPMSMAYRALVVMTVAHNLPSNFVESPFVHEAPDACAELGTKVPHISAVKCVALKTALGEEVEGALLEGLIAKPVMPPIAVTLPVDGAKMYNRKKVLNFTLAGGGKAYYFTTEELDGRARFEDIAPIIARVVDNLRSGWCWPHSSQTTSH
jgi:hypothetical protein